MTFKAPVFNKSVILANIVFKVKNIWQKPISHRVHDKTCILQLMYIYNVPTTSLTSTSGLVDRILLLHFKGKNVMMTAVGLRAGFVDPSR